MVLRPMRSLFAMTFVIALASTGCGAAFKGSKAEVHFVSIPPGSDVRIDGQYAGETPTTARVSRNGSQSVTVSKEGFKDEHTTIKRSPDAAWWFWDIGSCVIPIALCIPLLVDALSGAWMTVDEDIRVKLDPLPRESRPATRPATSTSGETPL